MSTQFTITAKSGRDTYKDIISKGDAITYEFDFSPWQEDNNTITGATWTLESGSAAISGQSLTSGVASALITTSNEGYNLISITADTGTEKKKVWLEIYAKDMRITSDDYGFVH